MRWLRRGRRVNFRSSNFKPGTKSGFVCADYLSSKFLILCPLFSYSLEGQSATGQKIIHRSEFENYIFMHFLPGVPANHWLHQWVFITCQRPGCGQGGKGQLIFGFTEKHFQRRRPVIVKSQDSILRRREKQHTRPTSNMWPRGGSYVWDTHQPAPPFLIHPTWTPTCVPTLRFKPLLQTWVAQIYVLGAKYAMSWNWYHICWAEEPFFLHL